MTDEQRTEAKEKIKLYMHLHRLAWMSLMKRIKGNVLKFTDEEYNFTEIMCEAAQKQYDNSDIIIEDMLNDPTGLQLMELGMREHIEKFDNL